MLWERQLPKPGFVYVLRVYVCVCVHGGAAVCACNPRVKEVGGVVECLSHASKSIPAIIKKANNHSRNLMAFSGSPRGASAQNREQCWQLQKIIHSLLSAHLYHTPNGCYVEREEVNRYRVHTRTHKKVLMLHKPIVQQRGWAVRIAAQKAPSDAPRFVRSRSTFRNSCKISSRIGLNAESVTSFRSVHTFTSTLLLFGADARPLAQPPLQSKK